MPPAQPPAGGPARRLAAPGGDRDPRYRRALGSVRAAAPADAGHGERRFLPCICSLVWSGARGGSGSHYDEGAGSLCEKGASSPCEEGAGSLCEGGAGSLWAREWEPASRIPTLMRAGRMEGKALGTVFRIHDTLRSGSPMHSAPALRYAPLRLSDTLHSGSPTHTAPALRHTLLRLSDTLRSGSPIHSTPALRCTPLRLSDTLRPGSPTHSAPALRHTPLRLYDTLRSGSPTHSAPALRYTGTPLRLSDTLRTPALRRHESPDTGP
jgi:hypothetical protein